MDRESAEQKYLLSHDVEERFILEQHEERWIVRDLVCGTGWPAGPDPEKSRLGHVEYFTHTQRHDCSNQMSSSAHHAIVPGCPVAGLKCLRNRVAGRPLRPDQV